MALEIEYKDVPPSVIPRPPAPPSDNNADPSSFVPSGMSEEDRLKLKAAALEWTNSIGGRYYAAVGIAALTNMGGAASNMYHYRHGEGKTKTIPEDDVDRIALEVDSVSKFKNANFQKFIDLIVKDIGARKVPFAGYLSYNTEKSNNWFGQYANSGSEWFYALGGFFISYGAMALYKSSFIRIYHTMYIGDRYNWDPGKITSLPKGKLSWVVDDSTMDSVKDLKDSFGIPYFLSSDVDDLDQDGVTDEYIVNDSLMGSLQAAGQGMPFDISGSGTVSYVDVPTVKPKRKPL